MKDNSSQTVSSYCTKLAQPPSRGTGRGAGKLVFASSARNPCSHLVLSNPPRACLTTARQSAASMIQGCPLGSRGWIRTFAIPNAPSKASTSGESDTSELVDPFGVSCAARCPLTWERDTCRSLQISPGADQFRYSCQPPGLINHREVLMPKRAADVQEHCTDHQLHFTAATPTTPVVHPVSNDVLLVAFDRVKPRRGAVVSLVLARADALPDGSEQSLAELERHRKRVAPPSV